MVIQHDARLAAGFQHAPGFAKALLWVRAVMHHAIGIDDVECIRREWKAFRIGDTQIGFIASEHTSALCTLNRNCGKVNSGRIGSRPQPFQIISADARADLEHS